MSRGNRVLHIDTAAAERALLEGSKLSAVASEFGVSVGWLSHHVCARGLSHAWTTAEERRLLAELRAGRAVIVPLDSVDAGTVLASRMRTALQEYQAALL